MDVEAGLPGLADNERMPLLVREAFKGAMSDTLPALQSGAKAAILDAAKQQDEAAKAKVKKEKRETGVHPRDLILPTVSGCMGMLPMPGYHASHARLVALLAMQGVRSLPVCHACTADGVLYRPAGQMGH